MGRTLLLPLPGCLLALCLKNGPGQTEGRKFVYGHIKLTNTSGKKLLGAEWNHSNNFDFAQLAVYRLWRELALLNVSIRVGSRMRLVGPRQHTAPCSTGLGNTLQDGAAGPESPKSWTPEGNSEETLRA